MPLTIGIKSSEKREPEEKKKPKKKNYIQKKCTEWNA